MATTSARSASIGGRQSAAGLAGQIFFGTLTYALMIVLAVVFLFPFYMMVVGSFMPLNDLFSLTPNLWPRHPTFDNYAQLFKQFPYFRYLFNSFALAAGQTAGVVFFCSLAGFVFAKRQFPGRDVLFLVMLLTLMVPGQSTLIPWYLLMAQLGWLNTFLPLWVPFWAPAFGVFLMRQFIASTIPTELLDAGTSDGCSLFGLYWRIVVPIMLPAITILALLNFINAWNDFLYSLLVFNSDDMRTAPLALALFLGSSTTTPQYTWLFAGSVLATLPLVALYFLFQRRLMEGIMSGALKG